MSKAAKSAPVRMCCGCREHFDKSRLLRIVRTPAGEIVLDRTGKVSGRGAYFCGGADCLKKLKKNHRLDISLGQKIPDEIYLLLEEESHGAT